MRLGGHRRGVLLSISLGRFQHKIEDLPRTRPRRQHGGQVRAARRSVEEAGRDPAAVRVVVRGVVRAGYEARDDSGDRLRLSGSCEQIREDAAWLGDQGVTELFYDLNWDPKVGSPDLDPASATARAEEIIHALAL